MNNFGLEDYKDVYSCFKRTFVEEGNTHYNYQHNNWTKPTPFPNEIIKDFYKKGGALWVSTNGEVFYRFSHQGKICSAPLKKISFALSSFLNYHVELKEKRESTKFIPEACITISELLLIENEVYNPSQNQEFYSENNLVYRNTFKPTHFLCLYPLEGHRYNKSIILQYIYYLSNYNPEKFHYMLNWIAAYFKNLSNKSNIVLVLLGKNESGKEILFDEIIKPLFGEEYAIKITSDIVESYNISNLVQNKLFFNFDNITESNSSDKKTKQVLNDVVSKGEILSDENKYILKKVPVYGQTLITIDDATIPFVENSNECCSIFRVPDNIKDMYIPEDFYLDKIDMSRFTKSKLVELIKNDLENFGYILKSYQVDYESRLIPLENDDKNYFQPLQEENLDLYQEVIKDLESRKIKQQNLIKCFNTLYKDDAFSSSKTLMVKLRELDRELFKIKSITPGTGGVKYFPIP